MKTSIGWRLGILTLIGGLAAVAIIQSATGKDPSAEPATTPSTQPASPATSPSPQTVAVTRGSLDLSFDMKTAFEPVDPFEARLKLKRYREELTILKAVDPYSSVKQGQPILQLKTDKIDVALVAAQSQLDVASATLTKAQGDVDLGQKQDALAMVAAKDQLDNAQISLKRWDDIDGPIQLLAAALTGRISDFDVDNASDELSELRKMYKSEDLTNETADIVMKRAVRTLDLLKTMGKVTHSQVDRFTTFESGILRQQLVQSAAQTDLGMADLNNVQPQTATMRKAALTAARQARDEAQKNLDELKLDREMFTITSPIDGIVVYGSFDHKAWHTLEPRQLEPGEKIQPEQVIMTVYSPGKLRGVAACPEDQITLISPGATFKVTPTALPGTTYTAKCETIPIVADADGFNLKLSLPQVDAHIAPGYSATATFSAKLENVLLVPDSAISHNKVWISKPGGGEPEARDVVVGRSANHKVDIISGAQDGELILKKAKQTDDGDN
jgi:multidrug resistance efflux pump